MVWLDSGDVSARSVARFFYPGAVKNNRACGARLVLEFARVYRQTLPCPSALTLSMAERPLT